VIEVVFKNVGQGDSVLLEWRNSGKLHYGIIDCNLYNGSNPLLEEIIFKNVPYLDFVILSHLHHDHYSGMPELLQHCINNRIKIGLFLHTFTNDFRKILTLIVNSQRVQSDTEKLLDNVQKAIKGKIILDQDGVTHNTRSLHLYGDVYLRFLAPTGNDEVSLSKQRIAYENKKSTTVPNVNIMSTIVEISNSSNSLLFVSDATKSTFKRIRNVVKKKVIMTQVPHHGSKYNLHQRFWFLLDKQTQCPAVYSVGDIVKDKLPDKDVVVFMESLGFNNTSTNFVYGLTEHYGGASLTQKAISTMRAFSPFLKPRTTGHSTTISPRFFGDKRFQFSL
jgi:beta-lactamase superfamily II metal-dependent hydrolase